MKSNMLFVEFRQRGASYSYDDYDYLAFASRSHSGRYHYRRFVEYWFLDKNYLLKRFEFGEPWC